MEKFENLKRNDERFKVYRYLKLNYDSLCKKVKELLYHQVIAQSENKDFMQVLEWHTNQRHNPSTIISPEHRFTDQLAISLCLKDEYVDWSEYERNTYAALLLFDELDIHPMSNGDVEMSVDVTLQLGKHVDIEKDIDTEYTIVIATLSSDDPIAHDNTAALDFNNGNMDVVFRDIFRICDDIAIALNEAHNWPNL